MHRSDSAGAEQALLSGEDWEVGAQVHLAGLGVTATAATWSDSCGGTLPPICSGGGPKNSGPQGPFEVYQGAHTAGPVPGCARQTGHRKTERPSAVRPPPRPVRPQW
ncbi:hypothetical protein GCM10010245_81680 [Streptomyces spectabilis]|nr:hypothetical protein GCM10010245_81680 [Streptomyces spectabilis]